MSARANNLYDGFMGVAGTMGLDPTMTSYLGLLGDIFSGGEESGAAPTIPEIPGKKEPIKKLPGRETTLSLKDPKDQTQDAMGIGSPTPVDKPPMIGMGQIMNGTAGAPGSGGSELSGIEELISLFGNTSSGDSTGTGALSSLGSLFSGLSTPSNPFVTAQNPLGLTPGQGL